MSSFLITVGHSTIDAGMLCSFFFSLLLASPLASNVHMLSPLEQYCNTLFLAADASSEVVLLAMILTRRLIEAIGVAGFNQLLINQHFSGVDQCLLITVSCRLAFKWHDDNHMWWRQVDWEMVSGLPLDTIDKFEWAFVKAISFELFVSDKEYHGFAMALESLVNPLSSSPCPPSHFDTLALTSFSSSPAPPSTVIKTEPASPPLEAIKAEPLSLSPLLPVKVEELGDVHAFLAARLLHGDTSREVSMPTTTTNNNTSASNSLRHSV